MEAALVSVSTGVMKPLLCKLSKLLEEEYAKLKGVHRNAKFIREEMSTMSATLQMLANSEELNPQIKFWCDNVRELSYDMEDCIDDFMARGDHEHDGSMGFKGFFDKLKKLKPRHEIAKEIEQLKARAIEVSERHKRYNFVEQASNFSTFAIDPRLPALYEDMDKLVGIDGPKEHIIEWFSKVKEDENLRVLPIVGSGGLGKTTLANQVYHQLKGEFQCTAFVSVSRNPQIRKILTQILLEVRDLGVTDYIPENERQLIDKIRDHLTKQRYLVVIDDVWDTEAWKTIRLALFNNRLGSRIITTTRNVAVASCCSCDGSYVFKMEPLNFSDSRRLLLRRAFGSEDLCYPHLEEISNEILKKCGGLPLAIITISSLLADQHAQDEWNRVLTAIGQALAKDPDAGNMTKILSLSYFDLPHHLRTCLLYLTMFPEDYIINKQRLINKWTAEGLIREEGENTYQTGERYFHELINRSLIQPVDVRYGKPEACRVHDIILDFIACKAAEENFVTLFDPADYTHTPSDKVRRLCVQNKVDENVTMPANLILSNVRSLAIFGHCVQTPSFLDFTVLRVLDLKDSVNTKNHNLFGIERMIHLKYLSLGSCITELPRKIGQLQYLETLDIRGTAILDVPSTISRCQRLVRLLIHHRATLPDGIGKLQSLQELQTYDVFANSKRNSLQELGKLTNLRKLRVTWTSPQDRSIIVIESCMKQLISLCNVHSLHIWNDLRGLSLDSWCPTTLSSLKEFKIECSSISKVPKWMSLLANLEEVEITLCSLRQEDLETLGEIPALLVLRLTTSHGSDGRIAVRSNRKFQCLKYLFLYIKMCGTALEFEEGSMPKLKHLMIKFNAHKRKCLNGGYDFGIQQLSTLTTVEVDMGCSTNPGYRCYEPTADLDYTHTKIVANLIKTAVDTLPNHPTLKFYRWREPCTV